MPRRPRSPGQQPQLHLVPNDPAAPDRDTDGELAGSPGHGVLDEAVELARELLHGMELRKVRDPLDLEGAAASFLHLIRTELPVPDACDVDTVRQGAGAGKGPGDQAAEDDTSWQTAMGQMIDAIAAVRNLDALKLLMGLAALAPDPLAAQARRHAQDLEVRGIRPPRWLGDLHRLQPAGSWRIHHALGDGENIVLVFRGPAGTEHALIAYVDHNRGRMVTDAFLADAPTDTLALYDDLTHDDPNLTIEPIDPATAADLLRAALVATDRADPPVETEDYPAVRPLLDARLALLPTDGGLPELPPLSAAERAVLLARFIASDEGSDWLDDPAAAQVLTELVAFRCEGSDHRPLRWSPALVADFLLRHWPQADVDDAADEIVLDVLSDWVDFAARELDLPDHLHEDIVDAISDVNAYERHLDLDDPFAALDLDDPDDLLAMLEPDPNDLDGFDLPAVLAMIAEERGAVDGHPLVLAAELLGELAGIGGGSDLLARLQAAFDQSAGWTDDAEDAATTSDAPALRGRAHCDDRAGTTAPPGPTPSLRRVPDPEPDHPEPFVWTGIPAGLRDRVAAVVAIADDACAQALDVEYQTLARRLIAALGRKRPSPLARGRPEIWAGGVLWRLGRANRLFSRNARPHVTGEQLAAAVGAKVGTIAAKADVVGTAVPFPDLDPRYTRRELVDMGSFLVQLTYR